MVLFEDDDANYQEFIQAPSHRDGFILNTTRVRSRYAVIHRARCHTIQGVPAAGQRWTAGDYRKVWAESVEELQTWVSQELNAVPRPCGVCHPIAEPEMLLEKADIPIPVRQINAEVVVELVTEGGGEVIYRRYADGGWVYWSDGNTIDINDDDVDYVRSWHKTETSNFPDLLPSFWPHLSPLQIHPEWQAWFREAYHMFLKELNVDERKRYESFGDRQRRWARLMN